MGVIKRGILGGFSGKVANLVGSSWKGIAVVKSLPLSVANPRSSGQVDQRNAFSSVVVIARRFLADIVKPFWDRFASQMSGYNDFISLNISNFDVDGMVDPTLLVLSKGAVTPPVVDAITANNGSYDLVFSTTDNTGSGDSLASDICVFVGYNATKKFWSTISTPRARSVTSAQTLQMDTAHTTGNDIYVFGIAKRADGSKVSNTMYKIKVV